MTNLPCPPDNLDRWRQSERDRLIEARQKIPVSVRQAADKELAKRLDALLGDISGRIISLYWPFRGEPDLRHWAAACRKSGAGTALPVVVAKATPLIFRQWDAATKLDKGVWNIPIPPADAATVIPDIVLAPVVGLDAQLYRLGYGGGFFDRTIAAIRTTGANPAVIGVGYDMPRMETIPPHRFDIPMDHALLVPA